jgi:CBS domain-containing protein
MRTVGELMTHVVHTASPYDTVGDLRDVMFDRRLHAVPVVDENENLVGIVTSADLVETWPPKDHVHEVMHSGVHSVGRDTTVAEGAQLMLAHEVHHLPVVDDDHVVGIVSSFDMLRVVAGAEAPDLRS